MIRKNPSGDLPHIHESAYAYVDNTAILCGKEASPQASGFSESVQKANHKLVKGYKKLQNEF